MTASTVPTTIRPARFEDYPTIGQSFANVMSSNPMWHHLTSHVDPETFHTSRWENEARVSTQNGGSNAVVVLERLDTGELLGVAWSQTITPEHRPQTSTKPCPDGFDQAESEKLRAPKRKLQMELLKTYGDYLWVREFFIVPDYQGQGLGRKLMSHLIKGAKEQGQNIALGCVEGKQGFYEKLGFKMAGEPVMLADGKIFGVCTPLPSVNSGRIPS